VSEERAIPEWWILPPDFMEYMYAQQNLFGDRTQATDPESMVRTVQRICDMNRRTGEIIADRNPEFGNTAREYLSDAVMAGGHWPPKNPQVETVMVLEVAGNLASRLSLSSCPRLSLELKHEHGTAWTGLLRELLGEVPSLLESASGMQTDPTGWGPWAAALIAQRLYVNRTKTVQALITTEDTRLARSEDLIAAWEEQENGRALRRLILSEPLTDREREAIVLFLSGHTDRQAAERLGVEPGTIKRLLHRARKRLAESSALRQFVFD